MFQMKSEISRSTFSSLMIVSHNPEFLNILATRLVYISSAFYAFF